MSEPTLANLLHHLDRLLDDQKADGLTDADLLGRFTTNRDEAAFEVLVWRHGPMVHSLCRRLLRRREDADDAFQAAFLILVRKAGSISKRISLASWLYKVTYRVALEVRAREAKHVLATPCDDNLPGAETTDDVDRRDLQRVIAEEVDRLPEKYRLPVILCYLSGKTTEEAAHRLGCPRGTVLSRLATARKRLHARLVRRGLALTAAVVAAALEQRAVAAPTLLVRLTVKAALWLAGSAGGAGIVSGPVLSLMEGALKTMFAQKMKWAAVILVTTALVGGGVGVWFRQPVVAETPSRKTTITSDDKEDKRLSPAKTEETNRPIGMWERDINGYHLTLRIEADRMYGTYSGIEKDAKFTVVLEADYSVTKDSVLYGILTGGDVEGEGDKAAKDEIADAKRGVISRIDCPFSFRYRVDGNVLMTMNLNTGFNTDNDPPKDGDVRLVFSGRWKKAQSHNEPIGATR